MKNMLLRRFRFFTYAIDMPYTNPLYPFEIITPAYLLQMHVVPHTMSPKSLWVTLHSASRDVIHQLVGDYGRYIKGFLLCFSLKDFIHDRHYLFRATVINYDYLKTRGYDLGWYIDCKSIPTLRPTSRWLDFIGYVDIVVMHFDFTTHKTPYWKLWRAFYFTQQMAIPSNKLVFPFTQPHSIPIDLVNLAGWLVSPPYLFTFHRQLPSRSLFQ